MAHFLEGSSYSYYLSNLQPQPLKQRVDLSILRQAADGLTHKVAHFFGGIKHLQLSILSLSSVSHISVHTLNGTLFGGIKLLTQSNLKRGHLSSISNAPSSPARGAKISILPVACTASNVPNEA